MPYSRRLELACLHSLRLQTWRSHAAILISDLLCCAGLEGCQMLLSLDVASNQLCSLEGLAGCALLERLAAGHNMLSTLCWQHLPCLMLASLDVSSNRCACIGSLKLLFLAAEGILPSQEIRRSLLAACTALRTLQGRCMC